MTAETSRIPQYGLIKQIHESNGPYRQEQAKKAGKIAAAITALLVAGGIALAGSRLSWLRAIPMSIGLLGVPAAYFVTKALVEKKDADRDSAGIVNGLPDSWDERPNPVEWAVLQPNLDPKTRAELNG